MTTLKVCDKACSECLYGKNKIVDDERAAEIKADTNVNNWFICHKASIKGKKVMCHGYYKANKESSAFIILGHQLNAIKFVSI